ncbi:HPP family protein [Streptomyces sp. CNQ085]|uniref:HPP family protein n=1 Tax=Streptomyces sp. CNQ085 TaxID=2886944 RepID=UPI0027E4D9A5|nr:HPP family protein [Streptomyces sp. CNQ085]
MTAEPSVGTAPAPAATAATARLISRAPARPSALTVTVATAGSVAGLVLLVAIGAWLDQVWLIPPLAASSALVFGAPALPLAQPRSVVGGQLLSALTGFAVLAVAGSSAWGAGVAGGLALGVMMLARTPHSPAAATAVIVVAQSPDPLVFLPLLAAASSLLVAVGVATGRLRAATRYPTYWWGGGGGAPPSRYVQDVRFGTAVRPVLRGRTR